MALALGQIAPLAHAQGTTLGHPTLIPEKKESALLQLAELQKDFDIPTATAKVSPYMDARVLKPRVEVITMSGEVPVGAYYSMVSHNAARFGIRLRESQMSEEEAQADGYRRQEHTLPQDTLRSRAQELLKKYAAPALKWNIEYELFPVADYFTDQNGKKARLPSTTDGHYYIHFREDLGKGITGPSEIEIELYRDTGQLLRFEISQTQLSSVQISQLLRSKATFISPERKSKFQYGEFRFVADMDAWFNIQLLATDDYTFNQWAVPENTTYKWMTYDNRDSVVVSCNNETMVSHKDIHWPPLARGKSALIYADYFPSFLIDVRREGDTITLSGQLPNKGHKAALKLGSTSATVDDKAFILSGAPEEVEGRLYLPYELLTQCNGVLTRWDEKKNTLWVDTRFLRRP